MTLDELPAERFKLLRVKLLVDLGRHLQCTALLCWIFTTRAAEEVYNHKIEPFNKTIVFLTGHIHVAIVTATGRSDRRSDRHGDCRDDRRSDNCHDDRLVYTLQAIVAATIARWLFD